MFYGSVEGFKTYHLGRNRNVSPSWHDELIENALLVASEWLDNRYDAVWTGFATLGYNQVRKWPRETAVSDTYPQFVFSKTEIPERVLQATYEAAYKEVVSAGSLNVDFTPNKYTSVTIEGALKVDYAQNMSIEDAQIQIKTVDALMKPLLDPRRPGVQSTLSGASARV